jgi:steroid delta-isomerase
MAASAAQVREVIGKYMQAWSTGDKALLLSIFAADATWEDPVGTPAFVGHEGVGRFWDFAHQGADQGRTILPRIDQIIACGNEGVLRFTMQVRVPAENKGLDLAVVDHFELNDAGLIRRARAFWDETCVSVPAGMALFAPNIEEAHKA